MNRDIIISNYKKIIAPEYVLIATFNNPVRKIFV